MKYACLIFIRDVQEETQQEQNPVLVSQVAAEKLAASTRANDTATESSAKYDTDEGDDAFDHGGGGMQGLRDRAPSIFVGEFMRKNMTEAADAADKVNTISRYMHPKFLVSLPFLLVCFNAQVIDMCFGPQMNRRVVRLALEALFTTDPENDHSAHDRIRYLVDEVQRLKQSSV